MTERTGATSPWPEPDDGVPAGELASASLDGELDVEQARALDQQLASQPSLVVERDGLAAVKSAVASLGPVEPPFGTIERIVADMRRSRPWTHTAGAWAAAAAAIVVVVGVAPGPRAPEVSAAEVDELAELHAAVTADAELASASAAGGAAGVLAADVVVAGVPEQYAGAARSGTWQREGVTHVLFGRGGGAVSVYVQTGAVAWDELGARGGETFDVDGDSAWRSVTGEVDVVVVERDTTVFVVIGAEVDGADLGVLRAPPGDWTDEVSDACGGVVTMFGFDS